MLLSERIFCGSDDYVLCYPDQKIVQFIPGTNKEFTVKLYEEEIGKSYLKTDFFLCNVSNVDDAADRKAVEDKNVSMERSCIGTSPTLKPSNIVTDHQNQNANNDEDEFANILHSLLFPSTLLQNTDNIQLSSISLQSIDNIPGFLQPPSGYQEELSCSRDFFSPSNGNKVFCPICNNAFSISTIAENTDLCLGIKAKIFFEKHTESSDEGELLGIFQNVSETKGNFDQNEFMLDIEKVLRDCEMDHQNELQIHVRRGFCFADFLKAFRKPYNAKKKSYRYIVTFIGESGIRTVGVSREFYSGL